MILASKYMPARSSSTSMGNRRSTPMPTAPLVAAIAVLLAWTADCNITPQNQKIVADSWNSIHQRYEQVSVLQQQLNTMLGPVMDHQFNISKQQLRRGIVYKGAAYRLRHTVQKLLDGKQPVKIGVVGGSITYSEPHQQMKTWFGKLVNYIINAFPNTTVLAKNGAIPGTPPSYAIVCLEKMVDEDVDLVFVEYIANSRFENVVKDGNGVKTYERLLRKLLHLPKKPAVVLMQVTSWKQGGVAGNPNPKPEELSPFHWTPEDLFGSLAQYYDVSWLSYRDAFWRLGRLHAEGYTAQEFYASDMVHPAGLGQKMMADLAVALLQDTAVDVLLQPWAQQDDAMLAEDIPEPMNPGNYEPTSRMCLYNEAFKTVVAGAQGFELVNEGTEEKPKWGYVGNTTGSVLHLRLNTQLTAKGDQKTPVTVLLAHLRSYEHMGSAEIKCTSGCTCTPTLMEAHHEEHNSQTHLIKVEMSQAPACVVDITILPGTKSGGHKIKVSGVMISTALDVFTHDGARFNHDPYYDFNEQNRKSLTGGTGHRLAARRLARRMT